MRAPRLKLLLKKYLSAKLTVDEAEEFKTLINNIDQETLYSIYNELDIEDPFISEGIHEYDEVGVLQRVQNEIKHSNKSQKRYFLISIASAVLILLLFKLIVPSKDLLPHNSNSFMPIHDISLLDNHGARLKLKNGQIVNLKEHKINNIFYPTHFNMNQDVFHYSMKEQLLFPISSVNSENLVFYTERGAMSSIVLEDGTTIWLNSATSLKFPTSFADKENRIVEIKGEAYFDVAHNKNKPFIVKFSNTTVTVLGTKFNIKAYPNENAQTTLVQGAVEVSDRVNKQTLSPGQQAVSEIDGQISVHQVNIEDFILWKNGVIQFNDLTIEQIINELRRWYDIKTVDNLSENQETYTGSLKKNKDLSKILNQLEYISRTKIFIKERRLTIIDQTNL